jgi:hypothetical protein
VVYFPFAFEVKEGKKERIEKWRPITSTRSFPFSFFQTISKVGGVVANEMEKKENVFSTFWSQKNKSKVSDGLVDWSSLF